MLLVGLIGKLGRTQNLIIAQFVFMVVSTLQVKEYIQGYHSHNFM